MKKTRFYFSMAVFAAVTLLISVSGCEQSVVDTSVIYYGNGSLSEYEKDLVSGGGSNTADDKMEVRRLVQTVPHERQLAWHEIAFYAFVHYGINTFTKTDNGMPGVEWGHGSWADQGKDHSGNRIYRQHPDMYKPSDLSTDQWCEAVTDAGFGGVIFTAKHHDGFCMWYTNTTNYAINSNQLNPSLWQKDVVRELSKSATRYGIEMGIYLSTGDGNAQQYGGSNVKTNAQYNQLYMKQIAELLDGRYGYYGRCPQYDPNNNTDAHWNMHYAHKCGEIFSFWIDGAQGHVDSNHRMTYNYRAFYTLIRQLQPNCVITNAGPDAAWIGNEDGNVKKNQWSILPAKMSDGKVVEDMSQVDPNTPPINKLDEKLGNREFMKDFQHLIYWPFEADVSIRTSNSNGTGSSKWFFSNPNNGIRPLSALGSMYERTVGGNVTLLMNIPPNDTGRFHQDDVNRLKEWGIWLRNIYGQNFNKNFSEASLLNPQNNPGITVQSAPADPYYPASNVLTYDETYWRPRGERESQSLTITLPAAKEMTHIVLQEQLRLSQRIEKFTIEVQTPGSTAWTQVFPPDNDTERGNTVGFRKICRFGKVNVKAIRINIRQSRLYPTLRFVGAYLDKN